MPSAVAEFGGLRLSGQKGTVWNSY